MEINAWFWDSRNKSSGFLNIFRSVISRLSVNTTYEIITGISVIKLKDVNINYILLKVVSSV